ncbi:MAG: SpoIID/LytB domain-containing protein [Firmicutes bacterium]|nr:SpoIID/LytB domain-containing protein [Bacillota bacterium]
MWYMRRNNQMSMIGVGLVFLMLISQPVSGCEFRVVIKTNGFAELNHNAAVISSHDGLITLIDYEQNIYSDGPVILTPTSQGILVSYGEKQLLMGTIIWIYPEHNGRLTIESIVRGDAWEFNPSYRGFIEVNLIDDCKLQIINTVTVEQYLYGVVPSEMASSWPLEALKAQAVASRTYVVRAIIESKIAGRNYHIDDSVFAQVYNNRQEDLKSKQAVDFTNGIVMMDDIGHLIRAYFHSTSCGITASSNEVWGGSTRETYPSAQISYLTARPVTISGLDIDFSDEDEVHHFLANKEISGYEQQSPWFRWQFSLTRAQLEQIINQNLAERYQLQPQFILTKNSDGTFESLPIPKNGIGELLDIAVVRRGAGGNIMTLEISGTTGIYRISKELNIRCILRPINQCTDQKEEIVIKRMNDEVINYPLLPSACVSFRIIRDNSGSIDKIDIFGGGNGHGVGMSQWGAKGMAEAGCDYQEILEAFYSGVKFVNIYETSDWDNLVSRE